MDPSRGLVLRAQPNSVPSEAVMKGTVRDLNQLVEDLDQSFSGALYRSGLTSDHVFVAINGRDMASETCHASMEISNPDGDISQEDVDNLLAAALPRIPAGRTIVHSMVRQWVLDGVRISKKPVGMIGQRLEVETHVVTGAENQIANLDRAFQRCGLKVRSYVHSLIAASEAVLTAEERNAGCVLVDFGGGTTDVGVFLNGNLYHSASIPIGSQSYVNDLKQGLGVSFEEAQRLMKSHGRAWLDSENDDLEDFIDVKYYGRREYDKLKRRRIYEIMQPRTEEIMERIISELAASGQFDRLAGGVIITGGGSLLRKLRGYVAKHLGRHVRHGTPQGIGHVLDEYRTPAYAVVLGLLLFGAKHEDTVRESGSSFMGEVAEAIRDIFKGIFHRTEQPEKHETD
jgi:cell division protein FtsA